uniref:Uncharacterized protein n=1 Tax=Arundo donax TaxID=35708 RepID=A0A0A9E654_ARUDO
MALQMKSPRLFSSLAAACPPLVAASGTTAITDRRGHLLLAAAADATVLANPTDAIVAC